MTTLTTVVSMIPMAMGIGDNGQMMQGLALVDVGGLTASTLLALLMLPTYYAVMDKRKRNVERDVPEAGYIDKYNTITLVLFAIIDIVSQSHCV